MKNYFKSIVGSQASRTLKTSIVVFEDANHEATLAALKSARAAHGGKGTVSVWRWAITVPMSVREIGMVDPSDAMQPGQSTGNAPVEEAA